MRDLRERHIFEGAAQAAEREATRWLDEHGDAKRWWCRECKEAFADCGCDRPPPGYAEP